MMGAAHLRVPLVQHLPVPQRLRLHHIEGNLPPLPLIPREAFDRGAPPDGSELAGEVHRIMHPAIHAHPAERVVHMRRIPGQRDAADDVALRHPLMHAVGGAVLQLIGHAGRQHALHAGLDSAFRQHLRLPLRRIGRQQQPPEAPRTEQDEPLLRVGDIGDVRQFGDHRMEGEGGGERQVDLRDRHPLEADLDRLPHRAPRAIGADQEGAGEVLGAAILAQDGQGHAVGILADRGRPRIIDELDIRVVGQAVAQQPGQPPLLALQPVGVGGVVLQQAEVEGGDRPGRAVPELPFRADQPHRQHRLHHAEPVQHVERRRVEGRGAEIIRQVALGLDDGDGDALLRQRRRRHQADRPRPRDQDPPHRHANHLRRASLPL